MIHYKINVMKELSKRGFTAVRMRKERILSESTMQRLRKGDSVSMECINAVCLILRCQPGDVIEVVPSDEEKIKYF